MKVNAFGVVARFALVAWTLFCAWQFFGRLLEIDEESAGASGAVLGQLIFWGGGWLVVSGGITLLYVVLGRSAAK